MKYFLFVLLALTSIVAKAEGLHTKEVPYDFTLTRFVSDTEIEIKPLDPTNYALVDDLLLIQSHETGETIGYATVKRTSSNFWIAEVKMHSKEALVRPGNHLIKVNLENYLTQLPGRFDLVRKDQRFIAARFKPLILLDYQLGQTAATLDKGEHLLGPSLYAYGITDHLQVDNTVFLDVAGVANAGIKYTVLSGEDYRVSVYTKAYHYFSKNKNAFDFEAQLDKTANTNMMTFTKVAHRLARPDRTAILTSKFKEEKANTEIQTIYGYILNNWHRVLLGPKYNFEQKVLGGSVTVIVAYNHFHWSLTLQTANLSNLTWGKDGYSPSADFYWRF